ncbi:MAG: VanZ family protein [Deltaproteobacteria bacterium]|nr:VanZ family protein [Deltaproteobacteria bacterium]
MKIAILITYMLLILATSLIPMDREIKGLQFVIGLKPTIQNLLHIPAYAILSILCLGLLKSCKIRRSTRIWLVVVSVVGFGILNEFIQMVIPGRYAGVMDMGLNTVGSILGIILYYKLEKAGDSLINETGFTGSTR